MLNNSEQILLNNSYDEELQAVLSDIKDCNFHTLRREFTKEQSIAMEGILDLPMPPPKKWYAQRQWKHYDKQDVFNLMCEKMEAIPALRSTNMDRIISKFIHIANLPRPE
jgi:hypothetical protein